MLCTGVVITLMFYRRGDSRHRPWISRLAWLITVTYSAVPLAYLCGIYPHSSWATIAWLITVTYSAVPLAYLCGIYPHSSWATIAANIIFLSVLVAVKGNVARLVDHLRH
nr:phage holin family protein [Enterobacter hormaechei]